MLTTFLLACALTVAQRGPAEPSEWQLAPRLGKGQELVYRGSFSEESKSQGVQFSRDYRMETRVFVLDVLSQRTEVALYTVLRSKPAGAGPAADKGAGSVRLVLGQVGLQGRIESKGTSLAVPLEGPPTIECGAFVESPRGLVALDQSWEAGEDGRTPRTWRVVGVEAVNNTRCVKLLGVQQSDDWDRPRADQTAWRRQDTVWVAPKVGYAYRVERTIERREPARREATQRSVMRYELESALQYPGQLYDDRRREITQASQLGEQVEHLLPRAGKVGPKPFDAILSQITYHLDRQPPTPYREAIRQVQRLAEAGRRNEPPPALPNDNTGNPLVQTLAVGRPAPDFLAADWTTHDSVRLRHWLGKPILLVFYSPQSPTVDDVLRFAQGASNASAGRYYVLALALAEDPGRVLKQRMDLKLTMPILAGSGLRISYGVETTPKFVVIDAAGVVRSSFVGWGPEMPASIEAELKHWSDSAQGRQVP